MRLSKRIIMASVVLVNITGAAMGLMSYLQLGEILSEHDMRWSGAMSQAVAKAITTDTLKRDTLAVREVLRRVLDSNKELVYLQVVDFNGEIFTSTFEGRTPAQLAQSHANCALGEPYEYVYNTIPVKDISFALIEGLDAHLHIGLNQNHTNAVINRSSLVLFLGGLVITLFGVLAAIVYGRRMSHPITELTNALHQYGQGLPLQSLSDVSRADFEIRELYQSFREMLLQRERGERDLYTRTSQLKAVVDASPIILFSCDKDGIFTMSEGAALANLGLQPEQVVGRSVFEVYKDNPQIIESVERVLQGESLVSIIELQARIFETHWTPVLDEAGQLEHILGIAVDISERIKAERELRQFNEQLEQRVAERTAKIREQALYLEQIHDAVITSDMDGTITGWNKGAERLFGYRLEEVIGKNIALIYPEDQLDALQNEVIGPLLRAGEHEIEVVLQKKSGKRFEGHLSLSLLRDAEGRPYAMVGYTLDITDRKQAEHNMLVAIYQAEEASRAKSEFLSRMSHELRTPMNAILGFGQILEQNVGGNLHEDELEYVNEVLKGGRHLLELINEVLDLSRVESGKMQISLETVELNELVSECVSLMHPLAEQKNIQIEWQPTEEYMVSADRIRLKQVILNLLSNAVKYNRENGKVTLRTEPHNDGYRLTVTDTGPGIPEAMQHRVFDPFDRLNADASSVEGTGIGLSLAKRLMEFMGGALSFSSDGHSGSSFWIDINAGVGLPEIIADRKAIHSDTNRVSQHKVLYVEDNAANLRLVTKLLEIRGGVELHDAHSADLAMALVRKHQFDLILLDIHLVGEEDGYDILHKLRAEAVTRTIPVVAISANASAADIERGLAAGFTGYITKPINVDMFYTVVDRYLKTE